MGPAKTMAHPTQTYDSDRHSQQGLRKFLGLATGAMRHGQQFAGALC